MIPSPDQFQYQTDRVVIVPYDKARSVFPPEFLGRLYFETKNEGLFKTVFPEWPDPTFNEFIAYLNNRPLLLYCIKQPEGKEHLVAGYGFIEESSGSPENRKASFGFMIFKKYRGTKEVRELIWECLRFWFQELSIQVLYGTSLRSNRVATNFSRQFGFKELCVLPGFFLCGEERQDGRLVCLERMDFMKLYEQHRFFSE
jgi:RimJ/RimL family protein N-acetyltransferase